MAGVGLGGQLGRGRWVVRVGLGRREGRGRWAGG